MSYVDGFIIAVPKARIHDYKLMAMRAGPIWREHGALAYVETIAEDTPVGELTSFPRAVLATDDEVVVLSWIDYPSRAERDRVSAAVMADERMQDMMVDPPFDTRRMVMGGFEAFMAL